MLYKSNDTVFSRSSDIDSPIDSKIYNSILEGEASLETIKTYLNRIDLFLASESSLSHPDYYEANRQLTACTDYLLLAEEEEKKNPPISPNNYFYSKPKIDQKEIDFDLDLILEEENCSDEQVVFSLTLLSKKANIPFTQIKEYYQAKKSRKERSDNLHDTQIKLAHLLKLETKRLNLSDLIPETPAKWISDWCNFTDLRPECALSGILATLSSCFDYRSQIIIHKGIGFTQPPMLWLSLVGESGTGKSTLIKKFSFNPLIPIQERYEQEFEREKAEANLLKTEYQNLSKEDRQGAFPEGEPKLPERSKRAFLNDTTIETFARLYLTHSGKTILYAAEELNKLFNGLNQYSGGKGNDTERLLELYDGGSLSIGRVNAENNIFVPKTGLSIFGGIQPQVLKNLWGDGQDYEGKSSRFLYVNQPLNKPKLPDHYFDELVCPLDEKLEALYGLTLNLPVQNYTFSKAAYHKFKIFADDLSELNYNSSNRFLGHCYSKAKGQCARLILSLHALNTIWSKQYVDVATEVSTEIVEKAIILTQFYLEQVLLLNEELCPDDELTPQLKDLLGFAKQRKTITPREAKMYRKALRNISSNEIREMLLTLEKMGFGTTFSTGKSFKFSSF